MVNFQFRHVTVDCILKSFYRNSGSFPDVRVRFAPSPTGSLHLGGLRTALYNYLYAKGKNGKFIIRIEDTDQKRLSPEAKDSLLSDLKWAGIEADEDPNKGGPFGPYIQSEKKELYNVQANVLLSKGHAYRCFCSERRLDLLRKECLKMRQIPKYDNKCRRLTPAEINDRIAKQEPHCIRFKMVDQPIPFTDIVFGEYTLNVAEQEGDPVIIKSDGLPTYHFANVIDDHFMKISHVLRGSEWLTSTTKHIYIYKAFEWDPPTYGHLPLLLNADGTKLSKRQNNISIDYYRRAGVFPMALVNFIIEQGGGFKRDWKHRKCYSMEELTAKFNVETIGKASGRLNLSTLAEYNKLELLKQIHDPELKTILLEKLANLIKSKYPNKIELLQLDAKHLEDVLLWSIERIKSLEDLVTKDLEFLWVVPRNDEFWITDQLTVEHLVSEIEKIQDFTSSNIKALLYKLCSEKKCKPSDVMMQIRKSLSGFSKGPGVGDMMEILGKHISVTRLRAALALHEKHKKNVQRQNLEMAERSNRLESLVTYKSNKPPLGFVKPKTAQKLEISTVKSPEINETPGIPATLEIPSKPATLETTNIIETTNTVETPKTIETLLETPVTNKVSITLDTSKSVEIPSARNLQSVARKLAAPPESSDKSKSFRSPLKRKAVNIHKTPGMHIKPEKSALLKKLDLHKIYKTPAESVSETPETLPTPEACTSHKPFETQADIESSKTTETRKSSEQHATTHRPSNLKKFDPATPAQEISTPVAVVPQKKTEAFNGLEKNPVVQPNVIEVTIKKLDTPLEISETCKSHEKVEKHENFQVSEKPETKDEQEKLEISVKKPSHV